MAFPVQTIAGKLKAYMIALTRQSSGSESGMPYTLNDCEVLF